MGWIIVLLLWLFANSQTADIQSARWFAFIGCDANAAHLYVVRSDGQQLRQLAMADCPSVGEEPPVAWSPDGYWIAFLRDGDLFRVRFDGSDETLVLDNLALARLIFASNKSMLSFYSSSNLEWSFITEIQWTPDAQRLILRVYENPGTTTGSGNLYSIDFDGNTLYPMTLLGEPWAVHSYDISPDGEHVVYSVMANCRYCNPPLVGGDIFIIDSDGRYQQQLTPLYGDGQANYPTWAADNSTVYYQLFQDGRWQGFKQRLSIDRVECNEICIPENNVPQPEVDLHSMLTDLQQVSAMFPSPVLISP